MAASQTIRRVVLAGALGALLSLATASSASAFGFLMKWGSAGSGPGQFQGPIGVATDSAANVYVADSQNHRVQKFTADGAFIGQWGSTGPGPGQFSNLPGIGVDPAGNVCTTEGGTHPVWNLTCAGTS